MIYNDKPSYWGFLVSIVFPVRCFCCDGLISYGDYICDDCRAEIEKCRNSRTKVVSFYGRRYNIHSPFVYKDAAESAVKLIKFTFSPDNAKPMGDEIAAKVRRLRERDFDLITAVPFTKKDKFDREYNHAVLMAKRASKRLSVPFDEKLLKKIRQTKRQHHLSGLERRTNLRGAFAARKDVKGKHILLIDDVVTTGATLCECADMLYRAGARKVTCATFAAAKYSN